MMFKLGISFAIKSNYKKNREIERVISPLIEVEHTHATTK